MDWFKGKPAGNIDFTIKYREFPVNFSLKPIHWGISWNFSSGPWTNPASTRRSWMEHGTYHRIMSNPAPNGRRHPRKLSGSEATER